MTEIRAVEPADWPGIWAIFRPVVAAGDTFPYDPETSEDKARVLWLEKPLATYVALDEGRIAGTYYLIANQPTLGAHVCNAGYMVHPEARRRGIGRAMCAHSLDEARRLGFAAMQYNLVAVTNEAGRALWEEMGFEVVGTLPKAFRHKQKGPVDALVMYRLL
ncbi:MAG: GNAT family N-acetyltransferase [Rhodospirillales bacterium]